MSVPPRGPLQLTAGPRPETADAPAVRAAAAPPVPDAPERPDPPGAADTRRLTPFLRGAMVPPSEVLAWLATASTHAGQPSSVVISTRTSDAHLHVATAVQFIAWAELLGIPRSRYHRSRTSLGPHAEATTTASNGWTLRVHLHGAAVEELT